MEDWEKIMSNLKILLIEDDEADQLLVKRSLKKANLNYSLDVRFDSNDLENILNDEDYSIIFLDYKLPDVDGITLLKRIRKTGYEAPIIVITSQGDEKIAVEALKSGASDYISKDLLTPEGISQSIRTVIKAYRADVKRKKGDLDLIDSEKRFKELFLNAPIAIIIEDLESNKILDLNNTACVLHGYDRNEMIGMSIFDTIPPDYLKQSQISYSSFEDNKLSKLESYCYTKEKKNVPIEIRISKIDYKGKLCNLLYMMDISERKKAQEALSIQQSRYTELIENSGALMMAYETTGVLLSMNKQCRELLNYTIEEIGNMHLLDLVREEFQPEIQKYLDNPEEASKTGGVLPVFTSNGENKYIMFKNVLHEESGKNVVLCYGQDITDRVIAERQINKAKNIAEESVKLKQEFLANMSHEIRTPMNAILGFSELLLKPNQKATLTTEQKQFIDNIHVSAESLIVVINDILDFSKMDANKLTIEKTSFNLYDVLHKLEGMFRQTNKNEQVVLNFKTSNNIPKQLFGDGGRIRQILINLISNALKFTHEGSIYINVEFLTESNRLNCSIIDTGIGIEEDRLDSIFMSFIQAEGDTTRKYGGTGLGLTICKGLVELMGGEISVTSKKDVGSTFSFSLPMEIDVMDLQKDESLINNEKLEFDDSTRILLAEDNPMNQLLAKKVLTDFGLEVDIANNGLEALEMFKKSKYDLILMDIQMPEMDGVTATKELREVIKTEIPIMAMTAHAMKEEIDSFIAAGMNDHISKPFKSELLKTKIYNLIKKT